jgi:hypothetical protein
MATRRIGVVEFDKGIVRISEDLTIRPGYTFADFKKCRYYRNQDGIRVIYLEERIDIGGRSYAVDFFFRNGIIYMLSLTCLDRDYTEEDEPQRKKLHDEILREYGIDGTAEYYWGIVSSNYDARGNVSSINLEYRKSTLRGEEGKLC